MLPAFLPRQKVDEPLGEPEPFASLAAARAAVTAPTLATLQPTRRTLDERIAAFERVLAADVVDLRALRELAFDGVPDVPGKGLRASTWKLLLGYLPAERRAWATTEASQRHLYHEWKAELMVDPSKRPADAPGGAGQVSAALVAPDAHPLTMRADSAWSAFFQNEELVREIEKDVSRTLPDYGFYASETACGERHRLAILQILFVYAKLNPGIRYVQGMNELLAPLFYLLRTEAGGTGGDASGGGASTTAGARGADARARDALGGGDALVDLLDDEQPAHVTTGASSGAHADLLGLDEAFAGLPAPSRADERAPADGGAPAPADAAAPASGGPPSATEPRAADARGAAGAAGAAAEPLGARGALADVEADAFFCFTNLMAETRDSFCQSLDSTEAGVRGTIAQLSALLAIADPELHAHLHAEKVSAQFFSFRWLTLLLSQEFDLPDILRIWDSFFADERRFRFVLLWCLAMLVHVREVLLAADFAGIIKTLQRYPDPDVAALHRLASRFYAQDRAGTLGQSVPAPRRAAHDAPPPPQPLMGGLAAAAAAMRKRAEDVIAGAGGSAPRRRNGPATSVEC